MHLHLQLLVIADPPGRFEILRVNRGPITYAAKSENRTSALTLRKYEHHRGSTTTRPPVMALNPYFIV